MKRDEPEKKIINILLIEDSADDAALIERQILRGKYEFAVTRIESAEALHHALAESHWDIILSDYRMPNFTGLDAFEIVKKSRKETPFILVSGTIGEETAVAAMKAGVFDYIMKDRLSRLNSGIEKALNDSAIKQKLYEEEKALRDSERRYRELFEKNPHPMWVYDIETLQFLDVNDAAVEHYGYSRVEFLSMTIKDIRPTEDVPNLLHNIGNMTEGYSYAGTWRHRIKNGSIIDVDISGHTLIFNERKSELILSLDVTKQRKAEKALLESEARFRTLAESSSAAIFVYNGKFEYMNQSAEQLTGYTTEELHQMSFEEIVHPYFRKLVREHGLALQRGEDVPNRFEFKFLRKDGKERWVDFSVGSFTKNGEQFSIGTAFDITDRKQYNEKLLNSEKLYRDLVENSNEVTYLLDRNLRFQYISPLIKVRSGFSASELLGQHFTSIVHGDDIARVNQSIRTGILEGRVEPVEFRFNTKSGKTLWVRSSVVPVLKENRIESIRGIAIDVTERKSAEAALLETTRKLNSMVNSLSGFVYRCSPGADRTIEYLSEGIIELLGYRAEEFMNGQKTIASLIYENDRERVWKEIQQAINARRSYVLEYRTYSAKGEMCWMWEKGSAVYDDGKILALEGFVTDITDRKLAEEKLRASEERFGKVFHSSPAAIGITTVAEGRFVDLNEKYLELLGTPLRNEVIGHTLVELGVEGDSEFHAKIVQTLLNQGQIKNLETQFPSLRQDKRMVRASLEIIELDGEACILTIANDVTEKKKIEEQLLRTQRLESLGTLAGGIAHDLNNVLAPITLSVELLKKNNTNNMSMKILESLESSAHRGSEIVKQILMFARGIESHKNVLQPRHLLKEIIGIFKETFPKAITIESHIPTTTWSIIGDPTLFHQMIMNLGVNARDSMPEGGILSIIASNEVIDEQYARMNIDASVGRFVKFMISDTGTGMSPQTVDHIFEPFFTTKEIGKGTGLGLSTVYSIVKGHNGFMKLKTELGKGTAFSIYLPASDSDDSGPTTNAVTNDICGHGELILIVDDEQSIREIMRHTLEANRYSVVTASDGAEGIARFVELKDSIDLVITDMMMPVMDGTKMIKALRKIKSEIKIITSSGLIELPIDTDGVENRVEAFIQKPYTAEVLLKTVKRTLMNNHPVDGTHT